MKARKPLGAALWMMEGRTGKEQRRHLIQKLD